MTRRTNGVYHVPFTSDSSPAGGLHVSAALGGGAPHAFLVGPLRLSPGKREGRCDIRVLLEPRLQPTPRRLGRIH